jgi:flagellin-specific chaperone FliS
MQFQNIRRGFFMNVIDTLFLALGVDTKGMDAGLAQAQQKIDAAAKGMAQGLMSPLKTAFGALAAGFSLSAITRQYLQQADSIGKMAESIGADVEELQAWGEAAARAGGSAQGFYASVQSLNRNLQLLAKLGKGPAADAFRELGIKTKDATGKARDGFEVLRDLAGILQGMDKQKAIAFGQRIGLDRGTILLLRSGRAAIDDMIRRQKELGLYTKEDTEIAGEANDAIDDLAQALKGGAAIIMRHIVPVITWVAKHLKEVVLFFKEHKELVVAGLTIIAAIITARLLPAMTKLAAKTALAFAPFLMLAAVVGGAAAVIEDFWYYMNGYESSRTLEKFWKKLGTGPELLAKFKKAWENAKKSASKAWDNITSATKKFFGYFKPALEPAKNLLDDFFDTLTNISEGNYEEAGKALGMAFVDAIELIKALFKGLWQSITDDAGEISFDKVIEQAKVMADSIKNFIWGAIKTITPRLVAELAKLPRILGKGILNLAETPMKLTKMLFEWLETGEASTELIDPKYFKEAKEIITEAKKLIDEDRNEGKGIAEQKGSSFADQAPPKQRKTKEPIPESKSKDELGKAATVFSALFKSLKMGMAGLSDKNKEANPPKLVPQKKDLNAASVPSQVYNTENKSVHTEVTQNFNDNSKTTINGVGNFDDAAKDLSNERGKRWSKIGQQASSGILSAGGGGGC